MKKVLHLWFGDNFIRDSELVLVARVGPRSLPFLPARPRRLWDVTKETNVHLAVPRRRARLASLRVHPGSNSVCVHSLHCTSVIKTCEDKNRGRELLHEAHELSRSGASNPNCTHNPTNSTSNNFKRLKGCTVVACPCTLFGVSERLS